MSFPQFFTLFTTFLLTVITPGPNSLLVVNCAMGGGRRGGFGATAGMVAGTVFWVGATLAGIVAILRMNAQIYTALQVLGALFLTGFGIYTIYGEWQQWRSRRSPALQNSSLQPSSTKAPTIRPVYLQISGLRAFNLALLTTTIGNPVAVIFYSMIFSSLVPPSLRLIDIFVLLIGFPLLSGTWFVLVTLLFADVRCRRFYERYSFILAILMGVFFLWIGLKLLIPVLKVLSF